MFRLVVLSVVLAVAAAAPGYVQETSPLAYSTVVAAAPALVAQKEISYQKSIISEPTVAHVGTIEKSVPTGYSHQSFTQYHNKQVAEPVFAPAVKKTVVSTPVEKTTYVQAAAPVVHAAPVAYAAPVQTVYAAPVAKTYSYTAPAVKTYVQAAAPAAIAYEAAPVSYVAPLKTSYVSSYPSVYSAPAVYANEWH
uniref:Uncharacterized protein n=1 Tax=Anopheles culicifacies TaxID=139723 RepID=A0A182MS84_9DIPT